MESREGRRRASVIKLLNASSVFFIFFATSLAHAADFYVDNAASGSNNGTSWANAWRNFSDINWGVVSPGDTVYISGGSVSKTYSNPLTIGASGTAGNPITITVGQSSPHNGRVILNGNDSGGDGITINGRSWVTISGQLGSGSTPNLQVMRHGDDEIEVGGVVEGVVLQYLEVGPNIVDRCIQWSASDYTGGFNRIIYNDIHNCYNQSIFIVPSTSAATMDWDLIEIAYNEIHMLGDDGIQAGGNTSGDKAGGLTIHHNRIHDAFDNSRCAAEGLPGNCQASVYVDAMQLRGLFYLKVYSNELYDLEGPDGMFSYIYIEADPNQPANQTPHDIQIFNNLIYETRTANGGLNHPGISILCKTCVSLSNVLIANNTIIDVNLWGIWFDTEEATSISGIEVLNNLFYNTGYGGNNHALRFITSTASSMPGTVGSYGSGADLIIDHNLVDFPDSGVLYNFGPNDGRDYTSHAAFEAACNCQANGVYEDPDFLSWSPQAGADLRLDASDTAARNRAIALTEFDDDHDGTPRPDGAAWAIGAFETTGLPRPRAPLLTLVE